MFVEIFGEGRHCHRAQGKTESERYWIMFCGICGVVLKLRAKGTIVDERKVRVYEIKVVLHDLS